MNNTATAPLIQNIQQWFAARTSERQAFLERCGLAHAAVTPIGEDMAYRRYLRLTDAGRSLILMEAVPDSFPVATPGHRLSDFIRIGRALHANGLHTPEIYEADVGNGYLLLEDFGDRSFKRALEEGESAEALYGLATDVLMRLPDAGRGIELPDYYQSHVHAGRRRLVDWYMPACLERPVADGVVEEYLAVWDGIERSLPPVPKGFLHIDFHFENLMLVDDKALSRVPKGDRGKIGRCGILDFQGAMYGPVPYDLANLLEDARVDVPPALRAAILERYCDGMPADKEDIFRAWYRVLATQFHCRLIGQFIKLAVRGGKPQYLPHIPRVANYIREALKDPVLSPLAQWCAAHDLNFSPKRRIDIAGASSFIKPDAF